MISAFAFPFVLTFGPILIGFASDNPSDLSSPRQLEFIVVTLLVSMLFILIFASWFLNFLIHKITKL